MLELTIGRFETSRMTGRRTALSAAFVLMLLTLAGCDKGRVDSGQVVARVNGDEISVHQLNFAIGQAPNRATAKSEQEALLEKMIDRQLALQQSLAQRLDRRPEVMLRLEEARRDILAAAFADDLAAKLEAPSEEACARYFGEHPGLFANRKIYRLREISIPEGSPALAEAQARIDRKEGLAELLSWLRQQPGRFSDQSSLRPAEQLPVEIVDRLSRLKRDETVAFRLPRALVIYQLQSAEDAPLTWAAAAPIIKAHLARQQGSEAFREDLKRLRSTASISRQALAN